MTNRWLVMWATTVDEAIYAADVALYSNEQLATRATVSVADDAVTRFIADRTGAEKELIRAAKRGRSAYHARGMTPTEKRCAAITVAENVGVTIRVAELPVRTGLA